MLLQPLKPEADCLADGRWANLARRPPAVMGIVNVTPDSFSDGGHFAGAEAAIRHGLQLLDDGAIILDIGGESTRPGASPVSPSEEQARILPVITALAPMVRQRGALISVDTRHSQTMALALAAGADLVNDVTALTGDPQSLAVVAAVGCPVILMHMQGEPGTMQNTPSYGNLLDEIVIFLKQRVVACMSNGLSNDLIWVDPGIGFGKTLDHNLEILANLSCLRGVGAGIMLGVSRKSFIASISNHELPGQRLPGSLAAILAVEDTGLAAVRVHDVAETCQALAVWQAINAKKRDRAMP